MRDRQEYRRSPPVRFLVARDVGPEDLFLVLVRHGEDTLTLVGRAAPEYLHHLLVTAELRCGLALGPRLLELLRRPGAGVRARHLDHHVLRRRAGRLSGSRGEAGRRLILTEARLTALAGLLNIADAERLPLPDQVLRRL